MALTAHEFLPIGLACLIAIGFRAAIGLPRSKRAWLLGIMGAALLTLPWLSPADPPLWRGIAAIFCATTVVRLYDLHGTANVGCVAGYRDVILFLFNPFSLVWRGGNSIRLSACDFRRRLARGVLLIGASVFGWWFFHVMQPRSMTFAAEHSIKAVSTFLAVYGIGEAAFSLWSAASLPGIRMMDNFFFARTPAEFWRRYNRPVMQFFLEDVFKQIGGRRHPALAVVFCFAISGALHEYLATIAIGRAQGFQMAFFMIQGVAVAFTQRCRPRGPIATTVATMLTIAFMLVSSVLFFASASNLVGWYDDPPRWMDTNSRGGK